MKFHVSQKRLLDELRRFPKGTDDGIDALKQGLDLIFPTGKHGVTGLSFGSFRAY